MVSVAEQTSDAGAPPVSAMKVATIFQSPEFAALPESQPEKSAFLDTIVGRCGSLRAILSQVEAVAHTNATVMITGETGTGKEVIARAVHTHVGDDRES